jgi:hypothetical protein
MKSSVILGLLAVAGSVMVAKGLDATGPALEERALPEIQAQSVADYCTSAIPQVWQSARESGQDVDSVKGKLAYVAFRYVATRYCICNQKRFGEDRTDEEKALFGSLAGLNLKMHFSHHFTKNLRDALNEEARSLAENHRGLMEARPTWLKKINKDFRTCKREQRLKIRF